MLLYNFLYVCCFSIDEGCYDTLYHPLTPFASPFFSDPVSLPFCCKPVARCTMHASHASLAHCVRGLCGPVFVFVGGRPSWGAACVCLLTDWSIHSCHMLYYPGRRMLEYKDECMCDTLPAHDVADSGWVITKESWEKEFDIWTSAFINERHWQIDIHWQIIWCNAEVRHHRIWSHEQKRHGNIST